MGDEIVNCERGCHFYLEKIPFKFCTLGFKSGFSDNVERTYPYCHETAHIGSSCRWGLTEDTRVRYIAQLAAKVDSEDRAR